MASVATEFTELAGCEHPVMQSGMGPLSTNHLAAAVSKAGGLGTVSSPGRLLGPSEGGREMRSRIEAMKEMTEASFAVNIPTFRERSGDLSPLSLAYVRTVLTAREEDPRLRQQIRAIEVSGGFPFELMTDILTTDLLVIAKVGSTRHAQKAEEAGAHAIIAAGFEMGGEVPAPGLGTFVLVPNVTESVDVPVLLSGGARDGRSLAAALCLGAAGIAMGTRFIPVREHTDWHPAYAQAVIDAAEGDDVVFRGARLLATRKLRALNNPVVERLASMVERFRSGQKLKTYIGEEELKKAMGEGDMKRGLVSAGQVASGITDIVSVDELMRRIVGDAIEVLENQRGTYS